MAANCELRTVYFLLRISTPDTLPRQVSPEYGTRIESMPSSAVPVSVMAHEGSPGAVAVPLALHAITEPLRVPWAVPATFRSPAQVALNDPLAEDAVCSVTFHLKSVHVDGDGMTLDAVDAEAQLPISAATPAVVGPVVVLECSKPAQPAAAAAAATARAQM